MFGKVEELLIIFLIILLLFGAKRIPDLARSIGQSIKEVRKGFSGDDEAEKKPTRTSSKGNSKKSS